MDADLRAGAAIYNDGYYHAAHDAWEDRWLDLEEGTDDERFLHGLIQFTAAVYHAREGNDSGATGLAESAGEYLADLPADYRGVNLGTVRSFLADLAADPRLLDRESPPALTVDGETVGLGDVDFETATVAAEALAEELDYEAEPIEAGVEFARADFAAGDETSPFVTLVLDFVREGEHRGIVVQRLSEHVDRRQHREADLDGLFEERD